MKMPPQVFRLVLLTFAIVVSYLFARTLLTPQSFGEYGFYRGVALAELSSKTPVFAGKEAYGAHQPEILKTLLEGAHKTVSCESCHGAVNAEDLHRKPAILGDKVCMRCHVADPARPAWFKQIVVIDHYEDQCMECHEPHQPGTEQ